MTPNGKITEAKRVPGGTRICGSIDLDGDGNPMPPMPFCVVLKDSTLRKAFKVVRAEWVRFCKRVEQAWKR